MGVEGLVDAVAQGIRIHDGDHTKGATELAEIALRAAADHFRWFAERRVESVAFEALFRSVGGLLDPDLS